MPVKPPTIPVNALRIWSDHDWLYASCPNPEGTMDHLLRFHNDADGWAQLKRLISERRPIAKLGEAGDPIQHMVDIEYGDVKITKIHRRKPLPPQNDTVVAVLKRLGAI